MTQGAQDDHVTPPAGSDGTTAQHTTRAAPRIVSVTVTRAGQRLATGLPYECIHGRAAETIRRLWDEVDGFVVFLPVGATTRIVAPLLGSKHSDPAVVCVDDGGRFAVSLVGGHHGRVLSANDLARTVAPFLRASPVITTASDAIGAVALDELVGFTVSAVSGDPAGVQRAILDGDPVGVENRRDWPLPPFLAFLARAPSGNGLASARVVVSDSCATAIPEAAATPARAVPTAYLHPPSLVAGVGADSTCPAGEIDGLLSGALAEAGLARESIAEVATIDRRARSDAVLALGLPVRSYRAMELAAVDVPNPSATVESAVGTASVAEAAALLAAGTGGELAVAKVAGPHATVAIARRRGPRGKLTVVGIGPGDPAHRTPAAESAIRQAEVVIGYGPYLELCGDLIAPRHEVHPYPLGEEVDRCEHAVRSAGEGRSVALVCSGDPGIFALAATVVELAVHAPAHSFDVRVVSGVTAAHAAAALLGAPLAHDHAVISLSDLTTPWDSIAARLDAAARTGMALALYNPRSKGRTQRFDQAMEIVGRHCTSSTPVGLVTDAARPGQSVEITTLGALDPARVTMTTCVIVGGSTTRRMGSFLVTPRGRPAR